MKWQPFLLSSFQFACGSLGWGHPMNIFLFLKEEALSVVVMFWGVGRASCFVIGGLFWNERIGSTVKDYQSESLFTSSFAASYSIPPAFNHSHR